VRLISGWGFDALRLERIELLAATRNPASQRVAERAGFTREAVLRSHTITGGERQDMVAFGMLDSERPTA
jgi:RimJ/RimL family protein N-acetyltransferase